MFVLHIVFQLTVNNLVCWHHSSSSYFCSEKVKCIDYLKRHTKIRFQAKSSEIKEGRPPPSVLKAMLDDDSLCSKCYNFYLQQNQ